MTEFQGLSGRKINMARVKVENMAKIIYTEKWLENKNKWVLTPKNPVILEIDTLYRKLSDITTKYTHIISHKACLKSVSFRKMLRKLDKKYWPCASNGSSGGTFWDQERSNPSIVVEIIKAWNTRIIKNTSTS